MSALSGRPGGGQRSINVVDVGFFFGKTCIFPVCFFFRENVYFSSVFHDVIFLDKLLGGILPVFQIKSHNYVAL